MPKLTSNPTLDHKDSRIIDLTLSGKTPTEVGAIVGMSWSTVYRRMRRPVFKAALSEARAGEYMPERVELRNDRLVNVATVRAIRDDVANEPAVRLRAVQMLWDRDAAVQAVSVDAVERAEIVATLAEYAGDAGEGVTVNEDE